MNNADLQHRLAYFLDHMIPRGFALERAQIDFTDGEGVISINWRPVTAHYDCCLVATKGLDGFSVYRCYPGEELSEDEVLFEFEHDSDISKV